MSDRTRKPIHGPLSISLYDTGVWFLSQKNNPPHRIKMFDSTELMGLNLAKDINTQQLQYMSVNGFIERIELSVRDIQNERQNLMDLIKLISYSMLYRQFDARMWDIVIDSDLAKLWNRFNPSIPIGFEMNTRDARIQNIIKKHSQSILKFKQSLFSSMQSRILGDTKHDDEEKKLQLYLAIRYLNMVSPVFWLLLTVHQENSYAKSLLSQLESTLQEFIQRSDSPEFLALVMVEMVLLTKRILSKNSVAGDNPIQISVRFSSKLWKKNEHTRMHITITIGQRQFEELRQQVNEKSKVTFKKENLASFLNSESIKESETMSLYYLAYLKDACKRMNTAFDSFVNICPTTRQCLMNLVLVF